MPKGYTRLRCKICERHRDECGGLSKRGKCQSCAQMLVAANITGIALHRGPFFDHWRRQTLAAFGGVPVDELREGR